MLTKLDMKKSWLTDEERASYLREALVFMQGDNLPKLPVDLQPEIQTLIKKVHFELDPSGEELKLLMDLVLFEIHTRQSWVSERVYLKLMCLCELVKNHVAAYQIAQFLYIKQHSLSVHVIRILQAFANETGKPENACHIFNETHDKLTEVDFFKKSCLYIEQLKSLSLLGQYEKAFLLCLEKIKTFYNVSYDNDMMCFVGEKGRIELNDPCWANHGLIGFCFQLAKLFSRKKDNSNALVIAEFLYQLMPENSSAVLTLSFLYKKEKEANKIKDLLSGYLEKYPQDVRVCTHYIIFLIDINEITQAQKLCTAFIDNYSKHHSDLKKIKLLSAWFNEQPASGKVIFKELIQEFPHHSMVIYLAIRYALKIRDVIWQNELMAYAQTQFAAEPQLLELIVAFSKARMICAAIESNQLPPPNELLSEHPNPLLQSRPCNLPEVVARAFMQFCTCNTPVCQGNCLDNVYLTGSAVCACLDAHESGKPLDSNKLKDLDFAMQVPEIPTEPLFAGFQFSPHVLNLLTYKNPNACDEPDIDLMLYIIQPDSEDSPYDITSMIKDTDVTVNRLFLDKNGLVWDCLGGEAFKAYDGHYLKIHGDALTSLKQDQARALRVVKKMVQHDYRIDKSLQDALHAFLPQSWFESERLRKKFVDMLWHASNKQLIAVMQQFSLLGPDIDGVGTQEEVLQRCLVRFAEYCHDNQQSELLNQRLLEQTRACTTVRRQIKSLELQRQINELEQEIHDKRSESDSIQTNIEALKKQINKKSNKLFNDWYKEHNETNTSQLDKLKSDIDVLEPSLQTLTNQKNTIQDTVFLARKRIAVVARWQNLVDASQQRQGFFKEAVEVNQRLLVKRDVFKQSKSLNLDKLRELLSYSSNDVFSAFICLNLGCCYLNADEGNNPLLAWYYLKQVDTYVKSFESKDRDIQFFWQARLTPLLQQAFDASGLESMTEDDLTTQLANKTLARDEQSAFIEYYLSKEAWRASALKKALQSSAYRQSDFMNFIALYDEALALNDSSFKKTDDTIVKEISSFIKSCFNKAIYKELTWFAYIKQLKTLFKHPKVYEKIMQRSAWDYQHVLTLDRYKESETSLPLGDCLKDMHLAEAYLTMPYNLLEMNISRAIAHYKKMLKLLDGLSDDPDYTCFYAWADARLNGLESEKDRVVRLTDEESFIALIPLFETVINTFTSEKANLKLCK